MANHPKSAKAFRSQALGQLRSCGSNVVVPFGMESAELPQVGAPTPGGNRVRRFHHQGPSSGRPIQRQVSCAQDGSSQILPHVPHSPSHPFPCTSSVVLPPGLRHQRSLTSGQRRLAVGKSCLSNTHSHSNPLGTCPND